MAKGAVVVVAGTEGREGLGRVVNAPVTAREFKESGDEIVLLFDGAGTQWIRELADTDHKYHSAFERVRDVVSGGARGTRWCPWTSVDVAVQRTAARERTSAFAGRLALLSGGEPSAGRRVETVFEIPSQWPPTVGGRLGQRRGRPRVSRVVTMVTLVVRSGSLVFGRV
jgi:hypothetical protein